MTQPPVVWVSLSDGCSLFPDRVENLRIDPWLGHADTLDRRVVAGRPIDAASAARWGRDRAGLLDQVAGNPVVAHSVE